MCAGFKQVSIQVVDTSMRLLVDEFVFGTNLHASVMIASSLVLVCCEDKQDLIALSWESSQTKMLVFTHLYKSSLP